MDNLTQMLDALDSLAIFSAEHCKANSFKSAAVAAFCPKCTSLSDALLEDRHNQLNTGIMTKDSDMPVVL